MDKILKEEKFIYIGTLFLGPTIYASSRCTDTLSAFLLFIEPIENIIISMTNLYGIRKLKENWENIDIFAFCAYIGLLLLAGVYRSRGECITELWDDRFGRPIFRATMSLKRFKMITRCLRFDDKEDRAERRSRDKLAPIRNAFDKWTHRVKMLYTPGDCITVDEQLIPFRDRSPFTQYIPSKPHKYGIKVWIICDSKTYYPYNMEIFTGRDRNCHTEVKQGQRVVLQLVEGLSGRNVTCDNFFTSHELATILQKQKLTLVGTIRKNRKKSHHFCLIRRKSHFIILSLFLSTNSKLQWYLMYQKEDDLSLYSVHIILQRK